MQKITFCQMIILVVSFGKLPLQEVKDIAKVFDTVVPLTHV